MNILLLEDRGSASYYLKEALEGEGHVVLEAYNPNDALDHWGNREKTPIHCMIIDLNVPPEGLTAAQRKESCAGLLTGWIWLRDHVFPDDNDMRRRVILYSVYLQDLRKHVSADDLIGLRLVSKREPCGVTKQLLNHVRDINKLP